MLKKRTECLCGFPRDCLPLIDEGEIKERGLDLPWALWLDVVRKFNLNWMVRQETLVGQHRLCFSVCMCFFSFLLCPWQWERSCSRSIGLFVKENHWCFRGWEVSTRGVGGWDHLHSRTGGEEEISPLMDRWRTSAEVGANSTWRGGGSTYLHTEAWRISVAQRPLVWSALAFLSLIRKCHACHWVGSKGNQKQKKEEKKTHTTIIDAMQALSLYKKKNIMCKVQMNQFVVKKFI